MNLKRLFKHLLTTRAQVAKHFPATALETIKLAITESERTHRGEIRFVVEAALDAAHVAADATPRDRAMELFSLLRVWDTQDNSGVLIYVLYADHAMEIVADRGIHAHAGQNAWERIAVDVLQAFSREEFLSGALLAIKEVSDQLQHHVPRALASEGDLPDNVTLL